MNLLPVALVEALQAHQIDTYGGSHGLRDRGLLESAVARAANLLYYRPQSTVAEVAASLAWGLIANHAFVDGNKRIGFVALVVMLEANGWTLACTETQETEAVLAAASGAFTEQQWTAWVQQSTIPPEH